MAQAHARARGGALSDAPVALVVGAGDYIGGAIAKRFAAGGYTAAVGRRKAEQLAPLVAEIEASGGRARAFALDARDEANVSEVFAAIERELGPLEVVVFNVGANVSFPILETTSRVFRKVWEMACLAGFLCGREAARVMLPRQPRLDLLHGRHREPARRQGLCGVRVREVRAARARAEHGARARAREHPRRASRDRRGRGYGVGARADPGIGRDPAQLPPDALMDPASVGETYWMLHQQPRDAWTFELELRPYRETW